MEETKKALRRDKTIKVPGSLNNSKDNIRKAALDNRYIKLDLIPVNAEGFEVSARQKIQQYLKDGETFYFGRSKVRRDCNIDFEANNSISNPKLFLKFTLRNPKIIFYLK